MLQDPRSLDHRTPQFHVLPASATLFQDLYIYHRSPRFPREKELGNNFGITPLHTVSLGRGVNTMSSAPKQLKSSMHPAFQHQIFPTRIVHKTKGVLYHVPALSTPYFCPWCALLELRCSFSCQRRQSLRRLRSIRQLSLRQ